MKYQTQTIGFRQFVPYMPAMLSTPVTGTKRLMEAHGDFLRVFLWKGQEMRFVNHPDFYKQVLLEDPHSFSRANSIVALKPFLGKGLFVAEGEDWKAQRFRVKPAFHGKLIKDYDRIIGEEIEIAISNWQKKGGKVHLELEVQVLTLRIMLRTLLHDKATTDDLKVIKSLKDILYASSLLGQELQYLDKLSKKYLRLNLPISYISRKNQEALRWIRGETARFMQLSREESEGAGWFMKALLEAVDKGEIEEDLIYDEVNNLLLAGFDTTAGNVTWALHELSFNREWQDIVREEALTAEADSSEKVLKRTQTRKVIQEALRMYPPAWGMFRSPHQEVVLGGEIAVPKGAHMMFNTYALHRHADYWEEPEQFNPNRFDQPLAHPFAYVPFGHGPRICIGQQIAKIQATWMVSSIVKNFHIKPPQKRLPIFTGGVILAAKHQIDYELEPLSKQASVLSNSH